MDAYHTYDGWRWKRSAGILSSLSHLDSKSHCSNSSRFDLHSDYFSGYGKWFHWVTDFLSLEQSLSRFFRMNALAIIRLKQGDLAKIRTLGIYSSNQLDFAGRESNALIGQSIVFPLQVFIWLQVRRPNVSAMTINCNNRYYIFNSFVSMKRTSPIQPIVLVRRKLYMSWKVKTCPLFLLKKIFSINLLLATAQRKAPRSRKKRAPPQRGHNQRGDCFHLRKSKREKRIRGDVQMEQSVSNFDSVCDDEDNIACLADFLCQTEPLLELEGKYLHYFR